MIDKRDTQQILGCLMKKPQLLSEIDKYSFILTDFPSRFERSIFMAINGLYKNGATKIQPIDIENFIEPDQVSAKLFKDKNGIEYLQDIVELSEVDNFDFYYNRFKMFNLLKDLKKQGFDTSEFYCEDLANPKADEINQAFNMLSPKLITDAVRKKLLGVEAKYETTDEIEIEAAAKGMATLVDEFGAAYEIGMPIQGAIYNQVIDGAKKGTLTIRSAASGVGKALPNSTIIPTPNGERKVSEIQVGDYLFDAFGKPTKVMGVYPQGRKQVWYVRFKDGRVAKCCEDHLWSYCTIGQQPNKKKQRKFYTKTLKELSKENLVNNDGAYRILVPMNYAVEYEEKEFYIPPYIMGLALGDGCFRQNDNSKSFRFSSADEFLPNYIGSQMNWEVKKNSANYNWYFAFKEQQSHKNVWVEDFLKEYPELFNTKSETKFIPQNYLHGSIEQRFELLNGLLDTDGNMGKNNHTITYYTISPQLRDDVVWLCHSLGFKTTVMVDSHKDTSIGYVIRIFGRPEDKLKLFKLPRKKEIVKKWYNTSKRKESNEFNPIIEIGCCGYTEEMTCFMVDNEEHLFLTEDFIVTHNTRNAVADACYLAYPFRYNSTTCSWEQEGNSEKVLFIVTEQRFKEVRTMILAYLTDINATRFKYADFSDRERAVITQAIHLMEKYNNLILVKMPNPTIESVKTIVRENCIIYDIGYVFYDYIFIGPSLLNEFKGFALRNDEVLLMFATALKDLAVELDVAMFTSTQLNAKGDDNKDIRNEGTLAGGRSTINKADNGAVMARPTKEELEILAPLYENNPENKPNLVTDIFKVRSGEWTQVRIWSDMNLGTLKKRDLFITDSRMDPIDNFNSRIEYNIKSWEDSEDEHINVIVERLNQGEIID